MVKRFEPNVYPTYAFAHLLDYYRSRPLNLKSEPQVRCEVYNYSMLTGLGYRVADQLRNERKAVAAQIF